MKWVYKTDEATMEKSLYNKHALQAYNNFLTDLVGIVKFIFLKHKIKVVQIVLMHFDATILLLFQKIPRKDLEKAHTIKRDVRLLPKEKGIVRVRFTDSVSSSFL